MVQDGRLRYRFRRLCVSCVIMGTFGQSWKQVQKSKKRMNLAYPELDKVELFLDIDVHVDRGSCYIGHHDIKVDIRTQS